MVQQLRSRDDKDTVWRLYICLSKSANQIVARPDKYRDLIQSLFTFDWTLERQIVLAFINLIGHMVSSNPIFLIPTLQMLVKNLAPLTNPRASIGGMSFQMYIILQLYCYLFCNSLYHIYMYVFTAFKFDT